MSKYKVRHKGIAEKKEGQDSLIQPKVFWLRRHGLGIFISLFLVMATLVVYWQVRSNGFVIIDDDVYVTDNPYVQGGVTLKGLVWALTTRHASYWHPLTWLSHMLDCEIYGLNPAGHHLTNLLFHILNTLLLFLVLKQMTGALWKTSFVAALFALHPLHVESVAWVAERKDVLSAFFWILTMWTYFHYIQRPRLDRYLSVLLSFVLGLLSKPMLVTLPFVLLLLDYWPLGRFQFGGSKGNRKSYTRKSMNPSGQKSSVRSLVLEKIPFFALAAVSSFLTFFVAQSGGAIGSTELYPLDIRLANALVSYASYIGKMIWPHHLAVIYPYPETFPMWQVVGAGLLLVCISILVIRFARRYPYLAVGWLWYLGTLVPVIGLVQVGVQAMADRFTYIPLIGLFIMIAMGVPDILGKWHYQRIVLVISVGLVLSTFMVATRLQIKHWRNSITLFEHTLEVTSNNFLVHNNLGVVLASQGRNEEAIVHYNEALRIDPYYARAHSNLGLALARQGRNEEAINHYAQALRLAPNDAEVHNNLGVVLVRLGKIEVALPHFAEALRIKPDYAEVYFNLGNSLSEQGRIEEAIAYYIKGLWIKPDFAGIHYNLGNALVHQGRVREAIDHYTKALQIKPDFAEGHFNLGLAYLMVGNRMSALEEYKFLKNVNPNLANNLLQRILK